MFGREVFGAFQETIEHLLDGGVVENVCPGISGKLQTKFIVICELQDSVGQGVTIILGHDETIPTIDKILDFGRLAAMLGYDGQAEEEGLVKPEADVTGNRADVAHREDASDLEILGVVDFAEISSVVGVHPASQTFVQTGTNNDKSEIFALQVSEHLDEMIDLLAISLLTNAAHKENDFGERNPEVAFDFVLTLCNTRKVGEVDRIIGQEYFIVVACRDVAAETASVQDQRITAPVDVVKHQVSPMVIECIEIARLGPRGERDSSEFEPVDKWPEETVPEVQEENYGIRTCAQELPTISKESERNEAEVEARGIPVLSLIHI